MILKVAFLDVYHGDCVVVIFRERNSNACIVIDGGEKKDAAKRLATYLKYEQVAVIDLLVGTHIDQDHIYGLVQFLKNYCDKASDWNHGKKKCIHHYWGTKADPDWTPSYKKKRLRALSLPLHEPQMPDYVAQSVKQNQDLDKLVREHILNTDNIHYPALADIPPLDIFQNVDLKLLAPDIQINDSDIHAKAIMRSNAPYLKMLSTSDAKPRKRMTIEDLEKIVAYNAEEMAKIANRHANNQSIVFKLTPKASSGNMLTKWSFLFTGDAEQESWEMMRGIDEVRENLPSTVLKVPHHGSVNGIDSESFMAIKPKYSIISVGQKHGLPDGQTLNLIRRNRRRRLFCTERNNSKSKKGPCGDKQCVRQNTADFRSILFTIDTDNGREQIDIFTVDTRTGNIKIESDQIWCRVRIWPNI